MVPNVPNTFSETPEQLRLLRQRERPTAAQRTAERLQPILERLLERRVADCLSVAQVDGGERIAQPPTPWSCLCDAATGVAAIFHTAVEQSVTVVSPYPDVRALLLGKKLQELRANLPPFHLPSRPAPGDTSVAGVRDVRSMVEAVSRYAETLIKDGWLGCVLYQDETAAGYSYILRRLTVAGDVRIRKITVAVGVDRSAPRGEQVTGEEWEYFWANVAHTAEEHVHHLSTVSDLPLATYRGAVPKRVHVLHERIPKWVLPHLRVMEGTSFPEEVYVRDEKTEVVVHEKFIREYKYDPAVRLGDVVLAGWSSDELKAEQGSGWGVGKKLLIAAGVIGLSLTVPPLGRFLSRFLRPGI